MKNICSIEDGDLFTNSECLLERQGSLGDFSKIKELSGSIPLPQYPPACIHGCLWEPAQCQHSLLYLFIVCFPPRKDPSSQTSTSCHLPRQTHANPANIVCPVLLFSFGTVPFNMPLAGPYLKWCTSLVMCKQPSQEPVPL